MLSIRTSQYILQDKIAAWLNGVDASEWMVFESFGSYEHGRIDQAKKIILFGDFVSAYLKLAQMGVRNKEIWVLCEKAKAILQSLSTETVGEIKVVDRYALFSMREARTKRIDFKHEKLTLVYGGRISRSKNIKFLINLVSHLQCENPHIKLKIYGEFDDYLDVSRKQYKIIGSYKSEVMSLISRLDWETPPEFVHGKNESEWIEELDESHVCINLSTYWNEDFSVAVAQCQHKGLSAIVSDIGGHSDVKGNTTIHIPSHLIVGELGVNDDESINVQAKLLSELLLDGLPKRETATVLPEANFPPVSFENLGVVDAFDFIKSAQGQDFFSGYEQIWHHSSPRVKKVLFLKSTEQNHWNSLVRISRQIELTWLGMQDAFTQIICLDTDRPISKAQMKEAFKVDLVVAQALGEKTVHVLKLLRNRLGAKFKLVSYPHELASIMYAGLKIRELENFFYESDIFVNHCHSDIELSNDSFENINTVYMPAGFCAEKEVVLAKQRSYQLCYVGRISEQKNIHTLFWALSLIAEEFRANGGKLHIYGHHDHFGSPNFGVSGEAYLDQLGEIAQALKIEDLIEFHGHANIEDWGKFLTQNKYVGVFPSIHCDENFGYAPFDFLRAGLPVVLTKWGGFQELVKSFPNAHGVDVFAGSLGPYVSPITLAQAIVSACREKNYKEDRASLGQWQIASRCRDFKHSLSQVSYSEASLKRTSLSKVLVDGLQASLWPGVKARGWMLNGKIFDGYQDRRYGHIAKRYGAIECRKSFDDKNYLLAPWVTWQEDHFLVRDPLKGESRIETIADLAQLGLAFSNLLKN